MNTLKRIVKSNPTLQKLAVYLLQPRNEYRPRWWVSTFVNPFRHKRGKGAIIRKRTRKDLFPFNNFSIGDKSLVEDFATINNAVGDLVIGNKSLIGIGSVLIGPVTIGDNVLLAQNVVCSGLNHEYRDPRYAITDQGYTTKQITIEDDCWIGANVVVTAGVTIGKHAVVAAGSIVTKDVAPYSIVAGNPARLMKKYNPDSDDWESVRELMHQANSSEGSRMM